MQSQKKVVLGAAAAAGALAIGVYLLTRPAPAKAGKSTSSSSRQAKRASVKAAVADDAAVRERQAAAQKRVMDRVLRFLSTDGAHTKEELDALFDEVAGDDGKVSREEFAMVLRAPLLHAVGQLVGKVVHGAAALARRGAGINDDEHIDDGSLDVAMRIQDGIPKIQAGAPTISNTIFDALDHVRG
jgi:hypothetical protein